MMRALSNVLGKGSVTLVDDSGDVQLLQVTEGAQGEGVADRIVDKVPRLAEFGFASVPPLGALAMMLRRTADRARGVVIATSHAASRPKGLKPGDTVLYDVRGAKVQMTKDGMLIDSAGLPVIIQNATTVTIKASGMVRIEAATVEVTGDIVSRADGTPVSLNGLRDAYAAHKHAGVTTGSGTSGPTDHAA